MGSLLLSLALYISGVSVSSVNCNQPNLMGEYNTQTESIRLCKDNIAQGERDTVLKHEVIHAIHENAGMVEPQTLIPPQQLLYLSDRLLPDEDILTVLTLYDYPHQELEARLLSKLPKPVVGFMLLCSSYYEALSNEQGLQQ